MSLAPCIEDDLSRVLSQMPLCDGLQATREIREFERQRAVLAAAEEEEREEGGGAAETSAPPTVPWRPLKIIGLTANASEEDRRARR